jgi:hypothetical protein
MTILEYIISFSFFVVLQSLAINGWNECFKPDMIFYPIRKFLIKHVKEVFLKPTILCVKCQSSILGGATFWGTVLPIFGFHPFELWIFVMDVFILVSLNWYIYKKL